jgi:alpha-beta hydrolase superfamily lysophospholipase
MSMGRFKSIDDFTLSSSFDIPPTPCSKAAVVIIHGLGDHSQSVPYRNLKDFLVENGFPVLRYDLRGHGNSGGIRGHIDSFEQHRSDLAAAVAEARSRTSCSGVYLVASSLGGLIAIDYALADPVSVNGIIAIAPALSSSGASKLVRKLVPILSRILPTKSIDPGLDLSSISRDQAAATEYTSDPIFSTRLTIKAASEIMKAVDRVNSNAKHLSTPILILHGSGDSIVRPDTSQSFIDRLEKVEKSIILYSEARHNLLLETNRDQVHADILNWLEPSIDQSIQH